MSIKDDVMETVFVQVWNYYSNKVHETAKEKGWWETNRNDGELIALMHSELSEMLEGLRHGNPASDKISEYSSAEEEAADIVIRLMDMACARQWRVAEAIIEKMLYNKGRSFKHGRKKF